MKTGADILLMTVSFIVYKRLKHSCTNFSSTFVTIYASVTLCPEKLATVCEKIPRKIPRDTFQRSLSIQHSVIIVRRTKAKESSLFTCCVKALIETWE